jgi:hypothetical protein
MQFSVDKRKVMHVGRNNPQYEYKMNENKTKYNGRGERPREYG